MRMPLLDIGLDHPVHLDNLISYEWINRLLPTEFACLQNSKKNNVHNFILMVIYCGEQRLLTFRFTFFLKHQYGAL